MADVLATMRQIYFDGAGGPDVIRVGMAPVPQPTDGKVLVEVVAAGVNRPDCMQRAGNYPPPPGESDIPGLEIAGRVVALGPKVTTLKLGDAVCALVGSGGYADYALADAALCLPIPRPLTIAEAAGLPETFFTVYDNVFTRGRLKAGETFLVHGGSSGIGTVAIQLAKLFGARVIATAGSAEKCAFCRTLGADLAIDYKTQDFVEEVKKFTEKRGADVILDMVGGSYIQRNLVGARPRRPSRANRLSAGACGRKFQFHAHHAETPDDDGLDHALAEPRAKGRSRRGFAAKIWPLLDQGKAKPIIHATFPLEDARAAHELMESSSHVGKILLLTGK